MDWRVKMFGKDMWRKTRKLKVKAETNMVVVMAILGQVGVLIDGWYDVESIKDGTLIKFLATDVQWTLITYSLDHIDEIEDGIPDELFKR